VAQERAAAVVFQQQRYEQEVRPSPGPGGVGHTTASDRTEWFVPVHSRRERAALSMAPQGAAAVWKHDAVGRDCRSPALVGMETENLAIHWHDVWVGLATLGLPGKNQQTVLEDSRLGSGPWKGGVGQHELLLLPRLGPEHDLVAVRGSKVQAVVGGLVTAPFHTRR